MEGPQTTETFALLPNQPPELVWITAVRTEVVGVDAAVPMPTEFMCHLTMDINPPQHKALFEWKKDPASRIFILSQGTTWLELPQGFGVPVLSNEGFNINTQVLNHNIEHPNYRVRQKVTVEFIRDSDLKQPLKPLFAASTPGMKLLEGKDGYWNIENPDKSKHGLGCSVGEHAANSVPWLITPDKYGRKFTSHWAVKPGREENHYNITWWLHLPFDTKLHAAQIHLHPFGESLEVRDITANKSVFKAYARNATDRININSADLFLSEEGVPMYKDHEYELISIYNNTTSTDKDAMATVMFYLEDNEFKKPVLSSTASHPMNPKEIPIKRVKWGE